MMKVQQEKWPCKRFEEVLARKTISKYGKYNRFRNSKIHICKILNNEMKRIMKDTARIRDKIIYSKACNLYFKTSTCTCAFLRVPKN